ncbi:MAG: VWA domain-containing protein [Crocinitomicaceae bacterium]|nr:VWA domain-containing protein [Crocinitomicaceae bacterium]
MWWFKDISFFQFLHPQVLWALLLLPLLYWLLLKKGKTKEQRFVVTRTEKEASELKVNWVEKLQKLLHLLKTLAAGSFLIALAGPYDWADNDVEDYKKGIDIILAMDVSLSMYTRDFQPDRLQASKRVAKEFVSNRKGDRIGLVVYSGEAYTACPSTLDYEVLKHQIDEINGEYIEGGTAIGVGLGTAVARLRSDSLSTKVIILLTDGSNNAGELTPEMAAELARAKNVRVYTIGVGTTGEALSPVVGPFGITFQNIPVEIDEETLKMIAGITGGKYFRATSEEKLSAIYEEIDLIEKKKFLSEVYQGEPPVNPTVWIVVGLVLVLLSLFVERVFFESKHA